MKTSQGSPRRLTPRGKAEDINIMKCKFCEEEHDIRVICPERKRFWKAEEQKVYCSKHQLRHGYKYLSCTPSVSEQKIDFGNSEGEVGKATVTVSEPLQDKRKCTCGTCFFSRFCPIHGDSIKNDPIDIPFPVSEQKEYKADCIYKNEDCPICPRSLYQSNDTEKPATISTEEHSGSLSNQTDKKVDKESVIKPELDSVSVKEGWEKVYTQKYEGANVWSSRAIEDQITFIKEQIAQTQEAFVKMIDRHLEKRHLSDSLKLNMIRMDLESIKSKYIHTEERSTNNTE